MDPQTVIAERYRTFARDQAAGSSPTMQAWALAVAADPEVLGLLGALPSAKQQPNLVLAAARLHGAVPGDAASLHAVITRGWEKVRRTVLDRSTQTNEPARCAALVLGLQDVTGPVALLEVGTSAGLCLLPDRYGYDFGPAGRLDPVTGPSEVTIPVVLRGGLAAPARMPEVVWRAGLDLDPLDAGDPADLAWLRALVWPEHEDRRRRLEAASRVAVAERLDLRRGDVLLDGLGPLAAEAPAGATLVVTHSAVLAYLDETGRRAVVDEVARLGARRLSFEARGIDPDVDPPAVPATRETLFVAALDGRPFALGDGHAGVFAPVTV